MTRPLARIVFIMITDIKIPRSERICGAVTDNLYHKGTPTSGAKAMCEAVIRDGKNSMDIAIHLYTTPRYKFAVLHWNISSANIP